MDVAAALRQRLRESGIAQRELAARAGVTEGYVSQLVNGEKAPPSPRRTEIYARMEAVLELPDGFLSNLADLQLTEGLKKKLEDPPPPLFKEIRELILSKCSAGNEQRVRSMFEKEPFGELERLVTQKLLDLVKGVVRKEQNRKGWIEEVARLSEKSHEQTRIDVVKFLEVDIFNVSTEHWVSFLEPVIESWSIDLESFAIQIVLSNKVTEDRVRMLQFVEADPESPRRVEPGFEEFLANPKLSGDATEYEIEFLEKLRFGKRRPSSLYYYRELQSLRDPLHFLNQ